MKPFFDSTLPRGGDHILRGPVAIILGIGIVVSVAVAQTIQGIEVRRQAADFQLAAEQTINAIEDRVDSQVDLLRSAVSLFNSVPDVDRIMFQSFVADSLRRHPSISLVGWVPRVLDADRAAFELNARREGLTNYIISERTPDRRPIPAQQRPEYFPNLFLEPPVAQPATYGLDQAWEPARRLALDAARDSGEIVFSERLELPLVIDNPTAINAYAAVYRGGRKPETIEGRRLDLAGYYYGIVRPASIIEEMLKERSRTGSLRFGSEMNIDVFDTSDTTSPKFLFAYNTSGNSRQKTTDTIVTGKNDFVSTIQYGGRDWTFVARPAAGALAGSITWQTGLAFGAALSLSLLLAAYMHTVLNRSSAIEAEVSLRTNELRLTNELLRDSEDRIRVITDSVPALIAYVDRNLIYRFVNRRYKDIGIDPGTMIGKSMREVRGDDAYRRVEHHFARAVQGEYVTFETEGVGHDGVTRCITIECTPDVFDGEVRGFYVLARDVTAQRNAENELKRTYELLLGSEERLRVITNALPALIAHIDQNLTIDYANERFGALTSGIDDPIGKYLPSALGEERYKKIQIACQRALHGESSQLEFGVVTHDGRQISVLSDFTPDMTADGSIRGFYFVALNVTAQRALEIELDRFFRQSLSFMCVATYDGFLRRFNDTWTTVLGYTQDEIVATPYVDFIHPDDRPKFETAFERLRAEGDLANLEVRLMCKDGAERVILWNAAANRNERQIYATGHDITELKAIDRMKDEFVSTVSHELRTPLTSIKGALGLIRLKTVGSLPVEMNTMLDIAYKNCDRLVMLINDILDIEKIEAGKMDFHLEPVDIVPIVRNSLAANQAYADQFRVKLRLETGLASAMVRADEGRLMQVMANLLSNAAKFSPENGEVRIAAQRCGRMIRISVADRGPGIPDNFRSRIFEKFSQNDSSDQRKVSGTGLGLSIVKAIIERHGGRIDFESEPGKGSTFYFDIPEMVVEHVESGGPEEFPRILVCEDDPDVAKVLAAIVERCGYKADIALSAAEARSKLERVVYAGMTLDIVLPDMDGIQFFKELRADTQTQFLPVIVVSARAAESAKNIDAGTVNIVDWLDKPIDEQRLADALKSAIAMSVHRMPRILHIEDDRDIVEVVSRQAGNSATFVSAGSVAEARVLLGHERFDLVILDLLLPDGQGEELLPLMVNPDGSPIPVIVFSAVEAPAGVAERVKAALVKTKSTDQMLKDSIDAFVIRHNVAPIAPADIPS